MINTKKKYLCYIKISETIELYKKKRAQACFKILSRKCV